MFCSSQRIINSFFTSRYDKTEKLVRETQIIFPSFQHPFDRKNISTLIKRYTAHTWVGLGAALFLKRKYHSLPSILTTSIFPLSHHSIHHYTWLVFSDNKHWTEWKGKERVGWNKKDKESDSVLVTVGKYSMFEQKTFQPLLSQPYSHKHALSDRTNCLLSSWTVCHLPGDCWVELTVYQWWT